MRERIESALTWLEDHGLLQWLQHIFPTDHNDETRLYLRDYWIGSKAVQKDEDQHAAILEALDGQIAVVREGTQSKEFTIRPTDTLRVSWTVFHRNDPPTPQPEEPESVVIAEGYCR